MESKEYKCACGRTWTQTERQGQIVVCPSCSGIVEQSSPNKVKDRKAPAKE